jgi:hypothetical protein
MSAIIFESNVTLYHIDPPKENDENHFVINEKALIINFMDTKSDKILMQSEIEKKDAIELAKLILLKYNS